MIAPALPEQALRAVIASKPYGADVSHWEGHIDWVTASQYIDFAIMKATEGTSFVDGEFAANKQGCIDNHLPLGAYHFFLPSFDPIQQANHFVETVGDNCAVYVLDLERALLRLANRIEIATSGSKIVYAYPDDTSKIYGLVEYPPELKAAMDEILHPIIGVTGNWQHDIVEAITLPELVKSFLDRLEYLTNKIPWIYSSPYFWNTYMVPIPEWADYYRKWVAHWGVDEPTLPNGWTSYQLHQFSASGNIPGIPGAVDENWFNGDLPALWELFEFEIEPPPSIHIRVGNNYRRMVPIFANPNINSTVLGYAMPSSLWDVEALISGNDGRYYYKMGMSGFIPAALCIEIEG